MDRPVIILAGGFGTRLRHIVSEVPKPMAPIGETPFLRYILDYLIDQGLRHVVLATGYLDHVIKDYFGHQYRDLRIDYSHEESALGTGGAIRQAFERFDLTSAFVVNGDTLFEVDFRHIAYFHEKHNCPITMSIKYMRSFSRYGRVTWDAYNHTQDFHEKEACDEGWINGGVYLIDRWVFEDVPAPFSFESEILEPLGRSGQVFCLPSNGYFIDIGVPEDYYRFTDEKTQPVSAVHMNDQWTFFVDRDGVINKRIPGDYVRSKGAFEFLPQVKEAFSILRKHAQFIFIVTNQQGLGKGLMSEEDLQSVHDHLESELRQEGISLDAIYYCPFLAETNPPCRKPNVGMPLEAKQMFPNINWDRCIMIGDSLSDIEMGLRMGFETVQVGDGIPISIAHHRFDHLMDCAQYFSTR